MTGFRAGMQRKKEEMKLKIKRYDQVVVSEQRINPKGNIP